MFRPDSFLQHPRVIKMQQNLTTAYKVASRKTSEAGKWAKEHRPTVQDVRENLSTAYKITSQKAVDTKKWVRKHNPTRQEKAARFALCALDSIQEKPSNECSPYRLKRRFGKKHRVALEKVARAVDMLTYVQTNNPDMWQDQEFHTTYANQFFDAIDRERGAFDGRDAAFEKFAGMTFAGVAAGIATWYGTYFKAHHGPEYMSYGATTLVDRIGNTVIEHNNLIFSPTTAVAIVGTLLALAGFSFYSATKKAHPNHFAQMTIDEMTKLLSRPVVQAPVSVA